MATAARDRLARTLRGDAQTAFSVEVTARKDDLGLEVEGFGHVKFPVTPGRAQAPQPRPTGPVRPRRGDADRPGRPRHLGDPEASRPRRVGRREAEGHSRDDKGRARTAERRRAYRRPSLSPGL
jgi:hypothetical protein